jgi:anthranilate synthase component 1
VAVFTPTRAEFREAARRGNLVPVYRELLADADTPVSAYAKVGRGPWSYLLESVVGGEKWAAYSFIGVGAVATLATRGARYEVTRYRDGGAVGERKEGDAPDPLVPLKALLAEFRAVPPPGLPRFFGGAVGYFGYDVVRRLEKLPERGADELGLDDTCFVVSEVLLIFDNLRQTVKIVANALVPDGASGAEVDAVYDRACARIDEIVRQLHARDAAAAPLRDLEPVQTAGDGLPELRAHTTREAFCAAVRRAKEYILAGDVFQVVLSQRLSVARDRLDPFDAYRALRAINPSPYMFHLSFPTVTVTGASPEVLVRMVGDRIEVRPIAGTRPRGETPERDLELERELLADAKEAAEHVMLIDLGRNDVGRVAATGTVRVDEQRVVERYSHVMHLVSNVSGRAAPGRDAFDALRACFPAGTLTGAPKIRAMEIIEELEPARRGIYGGAVGYVSFSGNLDMAIAIRTIVSREDRVYVQAGAGIVADSDPDAEFEETMNKAKAVVRALGVARRATDEGGS